MKLTTTTFVSVDGVMQGIGAPDEDRSGGFERGGWTTPLFDSETGTYLTDIYQRADAFLFGRRTYEMFAASWGAVADPSMNAVAESLHSRPKYVASTTLTETQWANTTVLSGELRSTPGGELLVGGQALRCERNTRRAAGTEGTTQASQQPAGATCAPRRACSQRPWTNTAVRSGAVMRGSW